MNVFIAEKIVHCSVQIETLNKTEVNFIRYNVKIRHKLVKTAIVVYVFEDSSLIGCYAFETSVTIY